MSKLTQINNIKLNLNHYSGTDLYTDGDIEHEILKTVTTIPPSEYPATIEKANNWPYLYHLSHLRHNIVEWLPINKTHKVLEIGSGCGAITGMLAEKAAEVVCVDLSETRSKINAHRHKQYDNITIHIGNFKDIEPDLSDEFDFILFIGVFEYCCLYIDSPDPYTDMLRIVKKHLRPDGHLAIAIENRFGLKYWAGCTEDHLGTFFSGLEDYPDEKNARTFTCNQFEKMLTAAEFSDFHFYYPYPDYKFMTTLFSDTRLPLKGELYNNSRNFDRHRMELFNEKKVYDSILDEGLFPLFSNSYFVYTGKDTDTAYLRYSNDRAPEYQIRTEITKEKIVRKTALTIEAKAHIKQMLESYQALFKQYENTALAINKCRPTADEGSIEFEFINGMTLTQQMDIYIENNDLISFNELIEKYTKLAFLPPSSPTHLYNHDLIFTNIILDSNQQNKWTLIDYEWMLRQEISPKETAYRALYCYLLEDDSRRKIKTETYFKKWEITNDDIETYLKNERNFQDLAAGKRLSVDEMRLAFGMMSVDPKILIDSYIDKASARHVQIFFDTGNGFTEENSLHLHDAYQNEKDVLIDITVPKSAGQLRIDPADMPCVVLIHKIIWNNKEVPLNKNYLKSNGKKLADGYYLSPGADPNFRLKTNLLKNKAENHLLIKLEVIMLPKESNSSITKKLKPKIKKLIGKNTPD